MSSLRQPTMIWRSSCLHRGPPGRRNRSATDREEFGQLLAGRAQSKRLDLPGLTPAQGQGFGDVDWLANITNQIHQQPGLLRDLLGGLTGNREGSSSGGILSSPLAKAALAGIAAMLVKKVLGGR